MKLATLLVSAVLLVPSAAWAGCWAVAEHPDTPTPPIVMLCYDGQCEASEVEFSCGNAYGAQMGYTNGWHFSVSDAGTEVTYKGEPRDPKKLSCTSGPDEDGITVRPDCWFPM